MLALEGAKQVDHLGLHGAVERAGRLIQEDQLGPQHHGTGDGDALALPARQFVRVAVGNGWIELRLAHGVERAGAALGARQGGLVHAQSLAHDARDGHARGQRAKRVLEHDLHAVAQRHQLARRGVGDVAPLERDRAAGGLKQAQQRAAERGLARAGLAHDADRLAGPGCDRHAVDRRERAPGDGVGDGDLAPFDQRLGRLGQRRFLARRLGVEQHARVGVLGRGEDARGRPALHDLSRPHDDHLVRHAAHDAEIVGDEHERHAEPVAQLLEQRQDLRLHRHVERGGRLVGDQHVGLTRERHGDHHALALAARQFVRVGAHAPLGLGDPHQPQHLQRTLAGGGP